jgi:hypothetical protein
VGACCGPDHLGEIQEFETKQFGRLQVCVVAVAAYGLYGAMESAATGSWYRLGRSFMPSAAYQRVRSS